MSLKRDIRRTHSGAGDSTGVPPVSSNSSIVQGTGTGTGTQVRGCVGCVSCNNVDLC